TGPASMPTMPANSSGRSSGCTATMNSRGTASAWPRCAGSSSATAAASRPAVSSMAGRPSASPCQHHADSRSGRAGERGSGVAVVRAHGPLLVACPVLVTLRLALVVLLLALGERDLGFDLVALPVQ